MSSTGESGDKALNEARSHLLLSLSAHGIADPTFFEKDYDIDRGDGGGAEEVTPTFRRPQTDPGARGRNPLTRSELAFLSSLLTRSGVRPEMVRMASNRLSDASLFPPSAPNSTVIGGGAAGRSPSSRRGRHPRQRPSTHRDSKLQMELFRNYERSGVRPSLALRRMTSLGCRGEQAAEEGSRGVGGAGCADAGGARDSEEIPPPPPGAGKGKSSGALVRMASGGGSQAGFEAIRQSDRWPPAALRTHDENGAERAGDDDRGSQKKQSRHIQFVTDRGDGLRLILSDPNLEGLDNREDAVSEGAVAKCTMPADAATDGEMRPDSNDLSSSWEDTSSEEDGIPGHHPDAWDVLRDEYSWGYGYGDGGSGDGDEDGDSDHAALPFRIIGTSADDARCHPHVLSPPLMESLQGFMPETCADYNYLLKYSAVRDGWSLSQLLRNVRGSARTVLALETTDGHVLGSYTCEPWRVRGGGYYGGADTFVWRMRRSRLTRCRSVVEQAVLESELEVFPLTGANEFVQLCRRDRIGLGGGEVEILDVGNGSNEDRELVSEGSDQHYGFAISLAAELNWGTTSTSETFGSPCLTRRESRGAKFDVANLEVWAMTPYDTVGEAEQDEASRLFFYEEEVKKSKLNVMKILMGRR